MSKDSEALRQARTAELRLRTRLTDLATAEDDDFTEALKAVEEALAGYEELFRGDAGRLSWPADAEDRFATCRVELERLHAGDVHRRHAIGTIRLVMPRFTAPGEEGSPD